MLKVWNRENVNKRHDNCSHDMPVPGAVLRSFMPKTVSSARFCAKESMTVLAVKQCLNMVAMEDGAGLKVIFEDSHWQAGVIFPRKGRYPYLEEVQGRRA
jgi:hypothetical protein